MHKYLFAIFFVFIITGCLFDEDKTEQAPDVPSFKTFYLNIPGLDSSLQKNSYDLEYYNRSVAFFKISVWNLLIKENIYNQYVTLKQFSNIPVDYFADNTWIRSYDFSVDSNDYQASLYSTFEPDSSTIWEMYFSVNDNDEFLILKGYNKKFLSQGNWTFYKYVLKPLEILKVDWLKTDSSFNIEYHNIYENSDYFGSSLSVIYLNEDYKNNKKYNILIDLYNNKKELATKIQIDSISYQGRILDSLSFNDNKWHYWDSNFVNLNW